MTHPERASSLAACSGTACLRGVGVTMHSLDEQGRKLAMPWPVVPGAARLSGLATSFEWRQGARPFRALLASPCRTGPTLQTRSVGRHRNSMNRIGLSLKRSYVSLVALAMGAALLVGGAEIGR